VFAVLDDVGGELSPSPQVMNKNGRGESRFSENQFVTSGGLLRVVRILIGLYQKVSVEGGMRHECFGA
jgi:hypothetical protein